MKLEGIHHVTAITADAPGNVDFYARVLGLRLVKKSVNQDDPTVYHLFYGDEAWRKRVDEAGASPTPVIDRFYFRSIYFREPSGVLFEIATIGPGFDVDEPLEQLGEHLSLPPAYEQLRSRLEQVLTPLPETRRQLATGGR